MISFDDFEKCLDPELQSLFGTNNQTQLDYLKENIRAEGLRDYLTMARLRDEQIHILIDGYTRYQALQETNLLHLMNDRIKIKEFDTREDAILWAVDNQVGRRNLSKAEKCRVGIRLMPIYEKVGRRNMARGLVDSSKPWVTIDEVSRALDIGRQLLQRYKWIQENHPEELQSIHDGGEKVNSVYHRIKSTDESSLAIADCDESNCQEPIYEVQSTVDENENAGVVTDEDPILTTDRNNSAAISTSPQTPLRTSLCVPFVDKIFTVNEDEMNIRLPRGFLKNSPPADYTHTYTYNKMIYKMRLIKSTKELCEIVKTKDYPLIINVVIEGPHPKVMFVAFDQAYTFMENTIQCSFNEIFAKLQNVFKRHIAYMKSGVLSKPVVKEKTIAAMHEAPHQFPVHRLSDRERYGARVIDKTIFTRQEFKTFTSVLKLAQRLTSSVVIKDAQLFHTKLSSGIYADLSRLQCLKDLDESVSIFFRDELISGWCKLLKLNCPVKLVIVTDGIDKICKYHDDRVGGYIQNGTAFHYTNLDYEDTLTENRNTPAFLSHRPVIASGRLSAEEVRLWKATNKGHKACFKVTGESSHIIIQSRFEQDLGESCRLPFQYHGNPRFNGVSVYYPNTYNFPIIDSVHFNIYKSASHAQSAWMVFENQVGGVPVTWWEKVDIL